ncbi:MAG: hypothetical protein BWX50_00086 [Euryarchaeota archaeon ADurb.Bin009]|nr:MAG: hypothetical protein BWX50_00086 [Euryarchaeota archaeon ADurb.Bin009]
MNVTWKMSWVVVEVPPRGFAMIVPASRMR